MPVSRNTSAITQPLNVDEAVRNRYNRAASQTESRLCCPVDYDEGYLAIIPDEIIERDYGCGDPSRFVKPGETVLDLGSGGGKICYIAAQAVGQDGKVFGIDCNDEMLALARKYQHQIGDQLGYHNVEFYKGKIQDLSLNLELLDGHLADHPVANIGDWLLVEEYAQQLRKLSPMIADDSINIVLSNCVLNLVYPADRGQLFHEMYRVLKSGGRAVISDIVSDADIPATLQNDPELWSGCISGAFREDRFLEAFRQVGFYGMQIVERQTEPWIVVDGLEFRSMTVQAFKGNDGPSLDRQQTVIYQGPWRAVIDDNGQELVRGQCMAVSDKEYSLFTRPPYADQVIPVPPSELILLDQVSSICSPAETKGNTQKSTVLPDDDCCSTSNGCC